MAQNHAMAAAFSALSPEAVRLMQEQAVEEGFKPRIVPGILIFRHFHAHEYPLSNFPGPHSAKIAAQLQAVYAAYKKLTPKEKKVMRSRAAAEGLDVFKLIKP